MGDTFGDEQHVTRAHRPGTHFGFPSQSTLDADDDLMSINIPVPKRHVLLAPLGEVDLETFRGINSQRGAVRFVHVTRPELAVENIEYSEDIGIFQNACILDWRRMVRK